MTPVLVGKLDALRSAVRADADKLPTLFWFKCYLTLARERENPRIRWAKLSGYVSRTARDYGIDGLDHAPARSLLTDFGLFQAVSLDDGAAVRDPEVLRALDLPRRYDIELLPEFQGELAELTEWVEQTWTELLAGMGESPVLAGILARWAPEGQSGLLPALIEAQEVSGGWLPPEVLAKIGQALGVPLSEVYGVATYYALLYTHPVGKNLLRVCDDVRCYLSGSEEILHKVKNILWIKEGETTPDGVYTLESSPCMGHCDVGPCIQVNHITHERVKPDSIREILVAPEGPPSGIAFGPLLLKHVNEPGLHTLKGYIEHEGFVGLCKALHEMMPEQVIAEIKAAGLVGRGGAAFPTGLKWELTARNVERARKEGKFDPTAPRPRDRSPGYVICNADESETGTFKDRTLLEKNPFQTLEGIIIAAYAVGVSYGYIYIRGEYPRAFHRFRAAVEEARAHNYLGENILGSGYSFDLEIRRGAGAYECGEETALLESIEGKRGEPRAKPPFPVEVGLFGKPTAINNVETLANAPVILAMGASEYRKFGTERSPGTRVTCLSGHVKRSGTYEVPMGTTLRHLIFELGQGLLPGRTLKAVLVGGVAGTFLSPEEIDVPLAFETLSAIGATFGSSAVIVFDDAIDMWQVLRRIARFFRDESCGKCFPCQIGTQRQLEIIERLAKNKGRTGDRQLLFENGLVMKDASLCGLGQFAASAIQSAFDKGLVRF